MKRPKKTYLVDEKDLQTINYDENQEDVFKGESIINAVNKVSDFEKLLKDQAKAVNNTKKSIIQTAKNISKKYKNLKRQKKPFLVKWRRSWDN